MLLQPALALSLHRPAGGLRPARHEEHLPAAFVGQLRQPADHPGSISCSDSQKSVISASERQTASVCRDVSGMVLVREIGTDGFGAVAVSASGGDEPISGDPIAAASSSGNSRMRRVREGAVQVGEDAVEIKRDAHDD